ncbi:hypothetical protein CDO87_02665 [Sagittula sp. P11]|uniref:BatD family protein n=1 Tax=Sagittula sp. P11 TaxID=2009329 RepID=UPI000C2D0C7A|nr:BatD family protein [Sagittula sp. P11]AUC52155.1 hypothetical protein CDO87_02665 [Sagittula sp. P11]
MVRWLFLLLLTALPAFAQDRDAPRLELILDPRDTAPFEGEMVLATLRGTYRQSITREEVKLRPMSDFDWVRLGMDRWTDERVDGLTARVFERRIAFYPRRAGALEILPITHALQVLGADGGRQDILVRSEPVTLTVQPKPSGVGDDWLPLRTLEVSDSWDVDPAQLADGQGATRRVVLRAFGATPEMMPPQPTLRQPWLISFTPPEERNFQVTPEGPVSTVVWTWKLRPVTGEPGVIPAITLPWFDTGKRTARSATIPASPIGYASFSANAASGWQPIGSPGWAFWGLAGLAAVATAAITSRHRAPARDMFRRVRRRWRRRVLLSRLRRLVRAGEVAAARKLASRLLEDFSALDETERLACLMPADMTLFGAAGDAPPLRALTENVVSGMKERRSGEVSVPAA